MRRILFKNEYFLSEKLDNGAIIITVLKDDRRFYGISLDECQFNTNPKGFIENNFTSLSYKEIQSYCKENNLDIQRFEEELRNRTLNALMSMIM